MQKIQEMRVQPLGQEDPLEKEMATHSRILTWKIPWGEESGALQSMGPQRVRHNWLSMFTSMAIIKKKKKKKTDKLRSVNKDAVLLIITNWWTQMSINWCMNNQMQHNYTMEYYSAVKMSELHNLCYSMWTWKTIF